MRCICVPVQNNFLEPIMPAQFRPIILAVLQQDAGASLQEVSSRVGLTSTQCWTDQEDGKRQGDQNSARSTRRDLLPSVIVQVTLNNHHEETLGQFGKAWRNSEVLGLSFRATTTTIFGSRWGADYEPLLRERYIGSGNGRSRQIRSGSPQKACCPFPPPDRRGHPAERGLAPAAQPKITARAQYSVRRR
jgi:Lrp/AsnC family leucine-responsive transcriptional regulator